MTDSGTPGPVLGRAALERVLARAAELQASSAQGDEVGGFTEEQLIELGREVGLPVEHLRQALAEERAHVDLPEESGVYASLLGGGALGAGRTVPGSPASVLAKLDE